MTSDSSILEEVSGLAEMKAAMSGPWTMARHVPLSADFVGIIGILASEGWMETWKPSMSLTTSSVQECYWMATLSTLGDFWHILAQS